MCVHLINVILCVESDVAKAKPNFAESWESIILNEVDISSEPKTTCAEKPLIDDVLGACGKQELQFSLSFFY